MPVTTRLGWIAAGIAIALGGCQQEAGKPAGKAEAGGQILPGSASDAMLPYDTVKSQPPLAPRTEAADGDKGRDRKDTGARPRESAAAASDDAPAPAPAPASGDAAAKAE